MNLKQSLLIFLFILVVLSKEVLVFNEEILVLSAFGVFIFLIHNFASDLISLELDSRNLKIEQEFAFYNDVQKKTFMHLVSYHKKQLLLCEEIKLIYSILKKDVDSLFVNYSDLLSKYLLISIDDKLRKILSIESKVNEIFQEKLNSKLYFFLLSRYRKIGPKGSLLILKSSIISLSNVR
jgi:hypothetical protein